MYFSKDAIILELIRSKQVFQVVSPAADPTAGKGAVCCGISGGSPSPGREFVTEAGETRCVFRLPNRCVKKSLSGMCVADRIMEIRRLTEIA